MNNEKDFPQGYKDFMDRLHKNCREKGTDNANIDCEQCGCKILLAGPGLVSMHVFMFPDLPYYTTKALCFNCVNEAYKEHGGKQIDSVLN